MPSLGARLGAGGDLSGRALQLNRFEIMGDLRRTRRTIAVSVPIPLLVRRLTLPSDLPHFALRARSWSVSYLNDRGRKSDGLQHTSASNLTFTRSFFRLKFMNCAANALISQSCLSQSSQFLSFELSFNERPLPDNQLSMSKVPAPRFIFHNSSFIFLAKRPPSTLYNKVLRPRHRKFSMNSEKS